MKELFRDSFDSNKVEIVEEKQQKKEIKLIGQQRKIRGLTLWEYNWLTHKIDKAKFKKVNAFISGTSTSSYVVDTFKVVVSENCEYVQALNIRNAIKKRRVKNLNSPAVWYCYLIGTKAVFLDHKDRLIKSFKSYDDAIDWAENNLHLV